MSDMIPRYFTRNMGPQGRRWFIDCPIHGEIVGNYADKEDAAAAWEAHHIARHQAA